eukprot:TRINITY_DN985_c0_g2_i1.p1 TRINITY_DN985_c0_g2~~TRINITY_DN985_c0_g2_i1.p1  ORF type:complete len:565 (-),score=70.07 TRINITY_DN985_c0_g2_i1:299-1813(-)
MNVDSESVAEMQKVTGITAEKAQFFLEASGGDLHEALNMCHEQNMVMRHENTDELIGSDMVPVPSVDPPAFPEPISPPPRQAHAQAQPLPAQHRHGWLGRIIRVPVHLLSGTFGLLGQAFRIGLGIFVALFGRWMIPFALIRRLVGLKSSQQIEEEQQARQRLAPSLLSPQQEAELFVSEFERNYGAIYPNFQISSWTDTTVTAHQSGKLAFILLVGTKSDDRKFCQQTLCRQEVVQYLNDNFKCWGSLVDGESTGDAQSLIERLGVTDINGFRVRRGIQSIDTPMCMLLGFSGASLQVISRAHGNMVPDRFMEWLMHAQEVFHPRLEMELEQQQEREIARILREEQDAAYVESLRLDQQKQQERERKLQEALEQEKRQQQEAERKRQQEEEIKQELERLEQAKQDRKVLRKSQLPQEPTQTEAGTALRFKLPDGTTQNRRFYENDKIRQVFEYVESLDNLACWNFNLVMNFPQREFSHEDDDLTLKDAELCPSAALFVRPQDD